MTRFVLYCVPSTAAAHLIRHQARHISKDTLVEVHHHDHLRASDVASRLIYENRQFTLIIGPISFAASVLRAIIAWDSTHFEVELIPVGYSPIDTSDTYGPNHNPLIHSMKEEGPNGNA